MDKLRAMRMFVRVVDAGSFSRVANELNVTTSMISKEIGRLEEDLGVRLLRKRSFHDVVDLLPVTERP